MTITGDANAETITLQALAEAAVEETVMFPIDFSVTTATASGNGSLAYNNAGVFTFLRKCTSNNLKV